MGYSESIKGYRLYDIEKKRAFFSRDVVFHGQENGLKKESNASSDEHSCYANTEILSHTDEETVRNIDKDDNTDISVVEPSQEPELSQLRRSTRHRRPTMVSR